MNLSSNSCPALVLNADYQPLSYYPLSTWSWKDALKAVFLERVNVVSEYDKYVRSPSTKFKLPSVISLKDYIILEQKKTPNFKGKISIEIISNNDYIVINITDNGTGISDTKKVMTPYFTTKIKGTGLGLPIVNKIINEHSGDFLIKNKKDENGVEIEISFPKINA